ncbi:hypothetical protein PT974_03757 [Cladobotryum mycophilum]|uniref:C2H2-type domain-containing protein n=1 Tax=Cladobotryum mycophilum TaxID=491253 RepID=A0ABR0ST68_9HYPO
MANRFYNQASRELGLGTHHHNHLPMHLRRDSRHKESIHERVNVSTKSEDQELTHALSNRRRFPESLHFTPSSLRHRSRTASTRSSISSANVPDSATSYSHSTLASPISTTYTSDISEVFSTHNLEVSRPASRVLHRHKPSTGTCSTYVNDDDEGFVTIQSDLASKIRDIRVVTPVPSSDNEYIIPPDSPSTLASSSPIKEEEELTPSSSHDWPQPEPASEPALASKWESSSTSSDDCSPRDTEAILDYTLQLIYGVDLGEASKTTTALRRLVCKFVGDVGNSIWVAPSDAELTQVMSTSSSSSTPSQGGSGAGSQGGGKRKKLGKGDEDEGDFSEGEGSGFLPTKRPRPNPRDDENLRLSCPFRKRNPQRFNVRDHHSCAMTYFPKFAELRQHIVKQHKRDDPSAFVCDRCNRDFRTRKDLRDHQRLPKELMCDISDHDPESGVDGSTSNKLLSRKRVSGASPEAQWKEIWNILFPDDEDSHIQQYHFTPVIEHFELSNHYLSSFQLLQDSLRDKISNPATLETLSTKFQQCFIEAVERCIASAQNMPYVNRSNKKNEPLRASGLQNLVPRKAKEILPRPDSGVVMMDELSEESGSIRNSAIGLGPRDSVRTVIKGGGPRRGSNLAIESMRDIQPAATPATSTMFDQDLMGQLAMPPMDITAGSMDPSAAVQAWNSGVLYPHHGDEVHANFPMGDHFPGPGEMTPHTDLNWGDAYYQTNFNGMGDRFAGFGGS